MRWQGSGRGSAATRMAIRTNRGSGSAGIRGMAMARTACIMRRYAIRAERRLNQAKAFTSQFGGQVVMLEDVKVDGRDLGQPLIAAGLVRPYDGARRTGWCGE